MKLVNATIRPATVIEVVDKIGTIKVSSPGMFCEDDKDNLPPVYPFFTGNRCSFSMVDVDDEVWLLSFSDNPLQLYYFRKDLLKEEFEDITTDDTKDLEVLASRDSGTGKARIYFQEKDGWIIQNQDSIIQILEEQILLKTPNSHRTIDISSNGISLGTEGGSAEPAVLGNKLVQTLNILDNVLKSLASASSSSPYTIHLGGVLNAIQPMFSDSIPKITSAHVTLD